MALGANTLAELLIGCGACDGLDPKNCAKATLKMVALGEKGRAFAARLMGDDFETFKRQWRAAYEKLERLESVETPAEKTTNDLWEDLDTEVE
ncbi:MAG: hypothetical protein GWP10_20495 [Nitrospiraceae bacterium]|nr:hypothetical protein [Nitrospiraceae bacterium]